LAVIVNSKLSKTMRGERVIDTINRSGITIPGVSDHPRLGPEPVCLAHPPALTCCASLMGDDDDCGEALR
jgi:hypothetical protein